MEEKKYTHIDGGGMPWRFEGSRPVSALADKVMEECEAEEARQKKELEAKKGETK